MIRTLCDLHAHIHAIEQTGSPTLLNRAVTGELYVELTSNGVRFDGRTPLIFFDHRAEALRAYMAEFQRYTQPLAEGAILYWRRKPEYERSRHAKTGRLRYCIHSRVLVSKLRPLIRPLGYMMPVLRAQQPAEIA